LPGAFIGSGDGNGEMPYFVKNYCMMNDVFFIDYTPDNEVIATWQYVELSDIARVYYKKKQSKIYFHTLLANGINIFGDGRDQFWETDRTVIKCLCHGSLNGASVDSLQAGHPLTHNQGKMYGYAAHEYKGMFEILEGLYKLATQR
jgi:hypothetical protein